MADRRDYDLRELARRALREKGLSDGFPPAVESEAERAAIPRPGTEYRDLRALAWSSIDNDDSRDLDQLSVAERLDQDAIKVLVAIADVDALVKRDSAVDRHAAVNTTSIYTAGGVFPMLPERLSTDLTSLNPQVDRLALVCEYVVDRAGAVAQGGLFLAHVRNQAKLTYNAIGPWLEGEGPLPGAAAAVPGLDALLRLQDEAAQRLRARREDQGALQLESLETRAVVRDGQVIDMVRERKNRAKELIEDFMIATNGVCARFLAAQGFAAIRRVVRTPERWDRIVELASRLGARLPGNPDAVALERFLQQRRAADPLRFPDLSLSVVKLMGKGEYVVERPGQVLGHFGLAVRDYAHSTAPNRRYPDLITHRLVKAALAKTRQPYDDGELAGLAAHCTDQEDAANKVERRVRKSAAALLLRERVGEAFDGIVTGASDKGTWVRIFAPPVEGKVIRNQGGFDVGDVVRVRLLGVDVEQGFIDFAGVREIRDADAR